MRRRVLGAAFWVLLAASIVVLGCFIIWPGTTVLGIDVGGLSVSAAERVLAESLRWDTRQVTIRSGDKETRVLFGMELGVTPDLAATAKGCVRPIWKAFSDKEKPLRLSVDEGRFSAAGTALADFFHVPVGNARLRLDGNRVVVVPHQIGKVLDVAALRAQFPATGYLLAIPEVIEAPIVEIQPEVRAEELEAYLPLEIVSSYTTYYDASKKERAHNIAVASAALSEVVIGPGETFSFNLLVGPRTPERGYKKAPVIVGDRLEDDYGGGVCQVSTTAYVAMLKAGFEITERYCHGLPVDYVPLGMDATVAWDYLDLKMTNPGPAPCILRATAGLGTLTVDVFGKKVPGLSIEVESKVLKVYPAEQPAAPPADPGAGGDVPAPPPLRPGYLVETIRRYIRNGVVEKSERLNTSSYPPEKPRS